jgi:HAD superfamily hydrolase (TIGR01509 family)
MIKAVIFDMDGLMIDSEPLQSKSIEKILKEYGVDPDYDELGLVQIIGITAKENFRILKDKHRINEDIDILVDKKQNAYLEILKENLVSMPGLVELLNLLKEKGIKMGVASSSKLDHIELVLSGLGIRDYFEIVVSGELLEKSKPHPEIYLTAAKQLGVGPKEAIALEDAEMGVISASSAGIKVIAVPNSSTKKQNFSKAILIVSSLEDINWDILSRI